MYTMPTELGMIKSKIYSKCFMDQSKTNQTLIVYIFVLRMIKGYVELKRFITMLNRKA